MKQLFCRFYVDFNFNIEHFDYFLFFISNLPFSYLSLFLSKPNFWSLALGKAKRTKKFPFSTYSVYIEKGIKKRENPI